MNSFYVGYLSLEALLNTHKSGPLYVSSVIVSHGGNSLVESKDHVIAASDVQDGVCRYWRMTVSRSQHNGGRPLDDEQFKHAIECAKVALGIVEKQIREIHKFEVHGAVVAMPGDLRILDGDTDCFRYDKDLRTYVEA